jgi:hypothetical protein
MEFKEFLLAVFGSWVEAVGIILTILPFIEKVPRIKMWLQDKPMLERFAPLLWVVGGACILWGFYGAWREQYRARMAAEQKIEDAKPRLVGQINSLALNEVHPDSTYKYVSILVIMDVSNTGGPSIVKDWVIEFTDKRGVISNIRLTLQPEKITSGRPSKVSETVVYTRKDSLLEKTAETPIPRGGLMRGVVYSQIDETSLSDIYEPGKCSLTIKFTDVMKQWYAVSIINFSLGQNAVVFPGVGTIEKAK